MNATSTPAKPRKKIADNSANAAKPVAKKPVNAPSKNLAPTSAKSRTQAPKPKSVQAASVPLNPSAEPAKAKTSQTKTAQPKALNKKSSTAPVKASKEKKVKVVRDSFTLPKTELLQITEMKKRAMALGVEIKKSELIRAGLLALAGMADTAFKKAMANVPTIKTGRPAKD